MDVSPYLRVWDGINSNPNSCLFLTVLSLPKKLLPPGVTQRNIYGFLLSLQTPLLPGQVSVLKKNNLPGLSLVKIRAFI